ncbi:MAG: peptide chain release factor N(5)-glutamine methyltransferase [Candidatus Omnitrophota bacterium]|nr:peptide chain release factor N(5)-glutamine methyltransferase [Candidatus Omnitrophota bacterium]
MMTAVADMTVHELLAWGRRELACLVAEEARRNAEYLLGNLLGADRASLYLRSAGPVAAPVAEQYAGLIRRRRLGEPLAYLIGTADFYNETLKVGPECLVPRPETEILVEQFLAVSGFDKNDSFSFLDLGSGSGAVGIALLRHYTNAEATFLDISREALRITGENLSRYNLQRRGRLIQADLFSGLNGARWDAIVSNPPYIADGDWNRLSAELFYEPYVALDGGIDGLHCYRRIAKKAPDVLKTGGRLFLEVGFEQSAPVIQLLSRGFEDLRSFKDLRGVERVVSARKRGV